MKKIYYSFLIALLVFTTNVQGQLPTGFTNIDINNIDAGISSSNDLFWNFTTSKFEVPKGSGLHSIFAGGMWIGGMDAGNQLYGAAQTYRQIGNDFLPGPIDTINSAPANWTLWDTSWKLNKTEVLNHIANYNISGYVVPQNIADWPGYNAALGRVLAPFADYNSNGIYDPENGDYPHILGDQTVYSIYNDLTPHTESGCLPFGIEVHRTMFGFDDPSNTALNNSIFSRYEIKNYSTLAYNDLYITMWIDFDLGNGMDDYTGTDMNLDMIYGYNGDANDEGTAGYGLNPPAMGVYYLTDSMTSSIAYDNVNAFPNGNPNGCIDILNYLNGIWLDNQPVTYGSNGRDITNPPTNHMYPGSTDPFYYPSLGEWSEVTAMNAPGDRRMIGTIGPFTLGPGDYKSVDVGFTWARAVSGGPQASILELQNAVSSLRVLYDSGTLTTLPSLSTSENQLIFYPNPASDLITIQNPSPGKLFDIKILDATGRLVFERAGNSSNTFKIDISVFSIGVYIVQVTQGSTFLFNKIMKN